MPKAIRFHKTGGPEVLVWEDVEVGDPGPGQIRVRHHAVGLNFVDVYQRSGLYPMPAAERHRLGRRGRRRSGRSGRDRPQGRAIAWRMRRPPLGAYSEVRLYPADRAVKIPDGISFDTAAAMMLKGMTAQYLIKRTFKVQPGQTVLWHAAAGGVGLIASQWLKALGVTVIGTVGSDAKAALAKAHGCEHTIVYTRENFVERVKEITGGKGVPVVYDSVGKLTFMGSLDCLQPMGMMVSFGNASGPVDAVRARHPRRRRDRCTLPGRRWRHYTAKREDLVACANDLFDIVKSGKVKIEIAQRYALKDAAQAHRDLEARKTTGSTVLTP